MPFKHIVDAVRSAFGGDFGGSDIIWGSAWAVLLCVLAVWWGTSTFRKESA
jgi:ABC-2 type transport system permease protein